MKVHEVEMLQLTEFTKLSPALTYKIWGGTRLSQLRQITPTGGEPLGETWEISIHPDGQCNIQGIELGQYLNQAQLPYLVKFIDTSDNLSIQVHPNDEYARVHENQSGKTECWIILDAAPGAGLYLGLKSGVTRSEFQSAIESNANVFELMNFYPLSAGEFFSVPAGSLHAIGKDVLLCEIQQSSGVTYRVWDWNRVDSSGKSRELHVKKAMDVAEFSEEKNKLSFFKYQNQLFDKEGDHHLLKHQDFEVQLWNSENGAVKKLKYSKRAISIVCLEGEFQIGKVRLKSFESAIGLRDEELKSLTHGRCLIIQ